jgi:hypothetical protein
MDEKKAYLWAVIYFFEAQLGRAITWAELAKGDLEEQEFKGTPKERAKLKRKLAEQARTNVTKVLRLLNLPG